MANKANITPPAEMPLVFTAGYQTHPTAGKSVYRVADNNLVVLNFCITAVGGGTFPTGILAIATLPVGARPSANIIFASVISSASGVSPGNSILSYVAVNGNLTFHVPTTLGNTTTIQGGVCYYAV